MKLIQAHWETIDLDEVATPDLIIADPPDNISKNYDGFCDNLTHGEYKHWLDIWLRRCCQFTGVPVFFTFNEKWIPEVEAIIATNGIKLIQRIYWHFTFGQNAKRRYTPSVRPIYWLNDDFINPDAIKVSSARAAVYGDKRAKDGGRLPNNLWPFSRVCGTFKERRSWHPCQLPEALVERIVLGHSMPEDVVLDPFIGSGTTAYVCQKHNRDCIGIDQSQTYLDNIQAELDRRASQ